jgi:hypothetical protein
VPKWEPAPHLRRDTLMMPLPRLNVTEYSFYDDHSAYHY